MGHEDAHERERFAGPEAPASDTRNGEIPVCRHRTARKPTQDHKDCAPHSTEGDHEFAKDPGAGAWSEYTKVLEQQCQLYQGSRDWVGGVANVENLERGKPEGSSDDGWRACEKSIVGTYPHKFVLLFESHVI